MRRPRQRSHDLLDFLVGELRIEAMKRRGEATF
jgi:hypothetical protein